MNAYPDHRLVSEELERYRTSYITSTRLSKLRQDLAKWSGKGGLQVNSHLYCKQLNLEFSPTEKNKYLGLLMRLSNGGALGEPYMRFYNYLIFICSFQLTHSPLINTPRC